MRIRIDDIKVNDRIRQDYGDIQALAEDIEKNGLIQPPVISEDHVLIAGGRRKRKGGDPVNLILFIGTVGCWLLALEDWI